MFRGDAGDFDAHLVEKQQLVWALVLGARASGSLGSPVTQTTGVRPTEGRRQPCASIPARPLLMS